MIFKLFIGILAFLIFSCQTEEENILLRLNSIDSVEYYSDEFIPVDYQKIYGKWKLYNVSGGFSGAGHEPNHDYLEIKRIGIYGIIKNDSIQEYGKIELDEVDHNTDYIKIRFIPDYGNKHNPYLYPPEKYFNLNGKDSLNLTSPCCDMYNYHYVRAK